MPDHDERLVAEVRTFSDELSKFLGAVFPGPQPDFSAQVASGRTTLVIIELMPRTGLELKVDGAPLLTLAARYRCTWDHAGEYLAIEESTFDVGLVREAEPLFRYDYSRNCNGKVPGAHLNVHGHRDELVFALTASGRSMRGKSRARRIDRGRVPRLADFHFPLGGPRFRPSLEDVVEIVVREFGLDTNQGWEDAVREGRGRWREKQLRSAVRDDPDTAAAVLRRLGYAVSAPAEPTHKRRDERVLAL